MGNDKTITNESDSQERSSTDEGLSSEPTATSAVIVVIATPLPEINPSPTPQPTLTGTPEPTTTPSPTNTPLPTTIPSSTNTPVPPTSTNTPPTSAGLTENLGLWEWGKPRPPMPDPADPDQVIFAHGDLDNSGTCHVKEFGPGDPVQGLGDSTFRLLRISGTPEQIAEAEAQQAAANGAGGSCPWLL